jgi:threonine synthase
VHGARVIQITGNFDKALELVRDVKELIRRASRS